VTLSYERVERVAAAVDEVTDTAGLNCGEALYAFTFMLIHTLKQRASPEVRELMAKAVSDSIQIGDTAPLTTLLTGRKAS